MENNNKTPKQLANEKYRQSHKEYYANYYREYRKTYKPKNLYKIYRKRLDKILDFLTIHDLYYKEKDGSFISCGGELFAIVKGDEDEE